MKHCEEEQRAIESTEVLWKFKMRAKKDLNVFLVPLMLVIDFSAGIDW